MLHTIDSVEPELRRLDVTQSVLCALTEIPAGSLSDIVRGMKKASWEQEKAIYRWLEGLDRLIQAVRPLQLDFKKTAQIKQQIELLDAGKLRVSVVVEQQDSTQGAEAFMIYVDLNTGGRYFVRYAPQRPGGQSVLVNSPNTSDAAHLTRTCAEQIVASLTQAGYRGRIVPASGISRNGVIDLDLISNLWN